MTPEASRFDISTRSTVVRLTNTARMRMNIINKDNRLETCPCLVNL
ncbi:MAG: hypothetical protein A4E44_01878 [Methanosaeta sp. PtaB.Bin018]|nr:MAG: hypothetical protein A4E44_01878 [Methanosaeta sp. PtaB.Bin018]